jgi:hypothetical protein
MKICTCCKKELDESCFGKNKNMQDNLNYWCKKCRKIYNKNHKEENQKYNKKYYKKHKKELNNNSRKYYQENKKEIIENIHEYYKDNKKDILNQKKEYYQENKKELNKRNKKYYKKHKKEIKEHDKKYYEENKETILEYHKKYNKTHKKEYNNWAKEYRRNKRETDIGYRIECDCRSRILLAVKSQGVPKSSSTWKLLGLDHLPLKERRIFLQNHLQGTVDKKYPNAHFNIKDLNGKKWHIDHKIPFSAFNLKCSYHQKLCCHWSNLQILTAEDNLRKGDNFNILDI